MQHQNQLNVIDFQNLLSHFPRQRPVPAPRRNIKQPPAFSQGLAQPARTLAPKGEDNPPSIPPKPSHEILQNQRTRPTSPPVQHSASPRPLAKSPVHAAATAAFKVENQKDALQPVVTSKLFLLWYSCGIIYFQG